METTAAPFKLEALSVQMGQLESLWRAKQEVGERFKDAIEDAAMASGIEPKVIKAYLQARCRDKVQRAKRTIDQLHLVFDMLDGN